ncbi:transmembrane protein 186 [Haematobia irritans]|uniref:transmembrane protein 186 n=1 Tax=Haematobia irritans TaxID=7368 RepID=UPI003F4F7E3C
MSKLLSLSNLRAVLKSSNTLAKIQTPNICRPLTGYRTATSKSSAQSVAAQTDEWRSIYRLPLIPLASAFNRLKVPYAYLNMITVPGSFALEQASQLPPTTAILISSVGITTLLTLSICSYFIRNLIGIIYINDDNDKLKFAYVDYWGKRHDVVVELNDVVPESEKRKPSKYNFYQTLTLYSDEKVKYKLLQRFGNIEDPEVFVTLFGSD